VKMNKNIRVPGLKNIAKCCPLISALEFVEKHAAEIKSIGREIALEIVLQSVNVNVNCMQTITHVNACLLIRGPNRLSALFNLF
jgi:hypothetical protein